MGLPVLKKTWEFHHIPLSGATAREYLWTVKDTLLNMTHSPWTVHASCGWNGSAFDFGLTDYWVDSGDLVGGTGDRSWIVLTNSTTGAQFLINMGSTSEENCGFGYSPGGLYTSSGFDASTAPTATDYLSIGYRYGWGSTATGWMHLMQSTDGTCLRVFPTRLGSYRILTCTGWIMFDETQNAPPAWQHPRAVAAAFGETATVLEYLTYGIWATNVGTVWTKARVNGLHTSIQLGYIDVDGTVFGQKLPQWDQDEEAWLCHPMVCFATDAQEQGFRGEMTDLWWGQTTNVTGTLYGDDKQFAQISQMIFPWDGWEHFGD